MQCFSGTDCRSQGTSLLLTPPWDGYLWQSKPLRSENPVLAQRDSPGFLCQSPCFSIAWIHDVDLWEVLVKVFKFQLGAWQGRSDMAVLSCLQKRNEEALFVVPGGVTKSARRICSDIWFVVLQAIPAHPSPQAEATWGCLELWPWFVTNSSDSSFRFRLLSCCWCHRDFT